MSGLLFSVENKDSPFLQIPIVYIVVILSLGVAHTEGDALAEFENLQNEFFNWKVKQYPINFDDIQPPRLNSYSVEGYKQEKIKVMEFLEKLKSIDGSEFSADDKLSYNLMEEMLQQKLDGYKWHLYGALNPLSFMEGIRNTPKSLFESNYKDYSENNFHRLIKMVKGIRGELNDYKVLMRKAIMLNHTLHNVSVTPLIAELNGLISTGKEECQKIVYDYFMSSNMSSDKKFTLQGIANDTVDDIIEAYKEMVTFFLKEYFPNTRTNISVNSWTNSPDLYKDYLKWHLSSDIDPEEVYQLGLAEVERIKLQMKKIMDKQNFNGTISEYLESISKRKEFFLKTKEEIIDKYFEIISKIKSKLNGYFRNYPDIPITIRPMKNKGPAAMYFKETNNGKKQGVIELNVHRPHEMPTYKMIALALHEGIPGHHLQISYTIVADQPNWRTRGQLSDYFMVPFQFPFYTAFVEGWALYAEYLGEEMGFYKTDYDLIGRYGYEMLRAYRLVIDTGIHAKNMTRQEGIDLLFKYTGLSKMQATIEVDRYITLPGQACAYKVGEIKIRQLRERAEKALGPAFDVRDFHEVVLKIGSTSLPVLEQRVEKMIKIKLSQINKGHRTYVPRLFVVTLILLHLYLW